MLSDLQPTTAEGMRAAFEKIYGLWDELVTRASSLDESLLYEQVAGEWSFVETTRHLVYATDAWFMHAVLDDPHPYHPLALSHTEATGHDPGIDLSATPSFAEALEVRRDRQARVRDFVSSLTDEDLPRVCEPKASPGHPSGQFKLGDCLKVILKEEYWHSTFATRDLDALTPG